MKLDLSKEFDVNKAKVYFNKLLSNNKKIELKEIQLNRTVTQNAYLHVCIALFAIEFGYTIDEAKTLLKRECNFMFYEKNNVLFLKLTRNMLTGELTKFIEWIRNYSSNEGCYIPTADEYKDNRFEIDKHINSNKQFI